MDTETWASQEFTEFDLANSHYEYSKDQKMGEGVNEDSYVELIYSDDDFEDGDIIKRSAIIVDLEKMAISNPRDEGFDFDYWAKWIECVNEDALESVSRKTKPIL